MSNNHIDHLPKRLGDLPLVQLDLSNNRLGKSILNDWDWLDKQRIKSSLQNLNLSSNEVSSFCYIFQKLLQIFILILILAHIFPKQTSKTTEAYGVDT